MGVSRHKHIIVVALAIAVIAVAFWGGSRVPALNQKAAMGGDTLLEDPLSFEAWLQVQPSDPAIQRVVYTTLNWVSTNRQGMTFGILLAAALMTLFALLRRTDVGSRLGNTLLGVAVGAPLGVCVNCAAPIAKGLHSAGARVETTLAAMISSPTLNIVVLTMLFVLFPPALAFAKLGMTIAFILLGIPVLGWLFGRSDAAARDVSKLQTSLASQLPMQPLTDEAREEASWMESLTWFLRAYVQNLWFIVKKTVPLMLLAGLIGAIAVTFLPWETMVDHFPRQGKAVILLTLGLVAVFGLLLPVPIAFDVVVVSALLSAGLPMSYAMALLFTLGIFSIYSYFIVGNTLSYRMATAISVVLIAMGISAGVGAHFYEEWNNGRNSKLFHETLLTLAPSVSPMTPTTGWEELATSAPDHEWSPQPRVWETFGLSGANGAVVERLAFVPPVGDDSQLFTRYYGSEFQLDDLADLPFLYSMVRSSRRAIAAGDVNGDSWTDLVITGQTGTHLYVNTGGEGFVEQAIPVPENMWFGSAALVDLNGDARLDLFLGAYRDGNYVIYNEDGEFKKLEALPATEATMARAPAFADVDYNGSLDIILGNLSSGWRPVPLAKAGNALLRNTENGFVSEELPGAIGETLTSLVTDLNMDGWLDVFLGNDFTVPDDFFLGKEGGGLRQLREADGIIPYTATSTMSFDTADVNNDLSLEMYIGQISGASGARNELSVLRPPNLACEEMAGTGWEARCEERMQTHAVMRRAFTELNASRCLAIEDDVVRGDCIALQKLRWATSRFGSVERCEGFPDYWEPLAYTCRNSYSRPAPPRTGKNIPQKRGGNLLLVRNADGIFEDQAEDFGVEMAGWTWNAKFADLNLDQWQDLYVVNGMEFNNGRESNVLFLNEEGKSFAEQTQQAGLASHLAAGAFSFLDMDGDGDLDIIVPNTDGPVWVYRNNTRDRNAIVFELRDSAGNRLGIGSKVIIEYGPEMALHQLREIKASGGYMSFDPPEAHFGLGPHGSIASVTVHWSAGGTTELRGDFAAGYRYRITRSPEPLVANN